MTIRTAPPPSLDFSINAEDIHCINEEVMKKDLEVNDAIAALKPEEQTYENIVLPLVEIENSLAGKVSLIGSLKKTARGFRRCGLHLPEEQRNKLTELRKRLSEVCIEYMQNWSREDSTTKFTKEELEGMDDDFLSGLKTEEEDGVTKYILTMKYPGKI
ncbi:unnamed protein product [Cunninghamella echinulata]